jgi:hypothetical protein
VSLHYEWTVSLRLRPDVPETFLEELRYHLGATDHAPANPTLDYPEPALAGSGPADELAGGPIARLVLQQHGSWPATWGLFARTFVLDDAMYELIQIVPQWLAPWSLTQGWIGFAREELDLNPWLNFYIANGHAYAAAPGQQPQSLGTEAPPFTATQTTEPWPCHPASGPAT